MFVTRILRNSVWLSNKCYANSWTKTGATDVWPWLYFVIGSDYSGQTKKKKHLEKRDVVIHGSVFFSLSLFLAFEAFRCVLIRWFWRHSCFYSVFVRRMGSLIVKADFQYSHRAPTCEHKKKQTSIKLCQESSLTIIHLHSLRCSPSAKQP